ncbi:MAG: type II secretion system F family protein [Deltaproteobacteria bacterium]|nr:type II secretion system F family protein [Deltaproteobacteria bacterium]
MALFQYRAADHSGKVVEGIMEAEAEHGVVARLHEMGFIPLRVAAPGEAGRSALRVPFALSVRRKVSQPELLHFTQELSTLLGAGLPLDRSLSVLSNVVEGEEFKKIVRQLLEGVRAGKSLSACMGEHAQVFSRLYVNMIRAGESGGILEGVLRHLVEYLERAHQLKEDVTSALIYPLLLVVVGGCSLIVLFIFVIPRFSLIFKDVNEALPLMTRLLVDFSSGLSRYGWIALLLLVVGGAGAFFHIRKPEGRLQWDRWRLNLWLVGDLLGKLETARFARTLAALLRGGVPVLEALGTVQGVVANSHLAQAIAQLQSRVKEGKGMARPMAESRVFPELALQMIAVGEETGKLEGVLVHVADHYDQEVRRTTKRLTSLLEPALILTMALIIGVVVISMVMGILAIYDLPS